MAYCTTNAVRDSIPGVDLGIFGDDAAQAVILGEAATAATSEVDARCRRTFVPPTQAEQRILDGPGGLLLRVPDMVRLDSVTVDGTPTDAGKAYPLDGPPYLWIATGARIPCGSGNVQIAGLWGYAETVPADIARATASLAAADVLVRLQADRSGGVKTQVTGLAREEFPEGGPYADAIRSLNSTAGRLLMPYRRWVV